MVPFSNNPLPPTRHRQNRPPPSNSAFLPHNRLPHHRHHHHHHQQQQQPPQFTVKLLSNHHHHGSVSTAPPNSVISQCNPKPYRFYTTAVGPIAARLIYHHQSDALAALVSLWEGRLSGNHVFTPVIDFGIAEDTNERIKVLFRLHVRNLLEGKAVKKLERKIDDLLVEIKKCKRLLKRPKEVKVFDEIKAREEGLRVEMEGIVKRIEEFRKGMKCVTDYMEGKDTDELGVLRFTNGEGFNWSKIHCLVLRECRRLEYGLPIYGFRSEILRLLHCQQVWHGFN